jgi:hypothetical protein
MNYHLVCNWSNTASVINGLGTAYPSAGASNVGIVVTANRKTVETRGKYIPIIYVSQLNFLDWNVC